MRLVTGPAEDGEVGLLAKRDLVVQEHEVPHLVEVEHHAVGDVARYGAGLAESGLRGHLRVVAEGGLEPQRGIEVAQDLVGVAAVDRAGVLDVAHPLRIFSKRKWG